MPKRKKEAETPPAPAFPSTFASRGPGVKEAPPFKWKLVAESDGFNVVLLKALEKKEAESAMSNLMEQGYYDRLQVYPIDAKIPQPKLAAIRHKERQEEERQARLAAKEAEKKRKAKELEKKKKLVERERLAQRRERERERAKVGAEKKRLVAEKKREVERKKVEVSRKGKSAAKGKRAVAKRQGGAKAPGMAKRRRSARNSGRGR